MITDEDPWIWEDPLFKVQEFHTWRIVVIKKLIENLTAILDKSKVAFEQIDVQRRKRVNANSFVVTLAKFWILHDKETQRIVRFLE